MGFVEIEADESVVFGRQSEATQPPSFSITGDQTPMVDIKLEPGQSISCELSVVMWYDSQIEFRETPGGSKQIKLLVNGDATEAASVTVMACCAGKAGVFELAKFGGRLLCPKSTLMAAGPSVSVSIYSHYRNIGPVGLDLLQLEGNGWAILRACGDVKCFQLGAGRQMRINVAALAAMSATIDFEPMRLEVRDDRVDFAELTGPGQVWLQSGA